MAQISRANLRLCGSHAGVSIGEDGPSQMALEDLARVPRDQRLDRALPVRRRTRRRSSSRAMGDLDGISFMRTTRADTPVIYGPDEEFPVGGSKTRRARATTSRSSRRESRCTRRSRRPRRSSDEGISRARDRPLLGEADRRGDAPRGCRGTGPIVTVEDHWPEGGLGEAVLSALADLDDAPRVTQARRPRPAALGQAGPAAERGRDRRRAHRRRGAAASCASARRPSVLDAPSACVAARLRRAERSPSVSPLSRVSSTVPSPSAAKTSAVTGRRARTASPSSSVVTALPFPTVGDRKIARLRVASAVRRERARCSRTATSDSRRAGSVATAQV